VTYVPARNTVLLSLALAWSEVVGAERVLIGVNALDFRLSDCRRISPPLNVSRIWRPKPA
jgi:7-cyano-7-deazaguanine synthase